jgi:hypothetical protein
MELTVTRRAFLGGAAALSVWPADLWGAEKKTPGGRLPSAHVSLWERPDGTATDGVMVRRLYLDLAGRLPTEAEARAYVGSRDPAKRRTLVETLLASETFADYWTMRFCDILRVKSEFPVNLWPNAVYVYHARVRSFIEKNETWEHFGRALLTSQGSNFRDAEVNFFRATDRRHPEGWAEAVAQTFLGVPPAELSREKKAAFAALLSNVRIKNTREWKEEIVYVEGADRRPELCERLFRRERQAVAEAFIARLRRWIFGPSAAPARPAAARSVGVKDALRDIVLSPEYARGSVTGGFPARRLDAEILDDVFSSLSRTKRNYMSPAPEPFSFLPGDRATVCLEDGSISSGFLSLFGRPPRDTGLMDERGEDVTAKQRLYLFNSVDIHRKLARWTMPPWRLPDKTVNPYHRLPPGKRLEGVYWKILSRPPSAHERNVIAAVWRARSRNGKDRKANYNEMMRDVAWSLINTKEFLFRI